MHDPLIEELAESGFSVVPAFLPLEICRDLLQESETHWERGAFNSASVGRGHEKQKQSEVRSDEILWLDPLALSAAQAHYYERMNQLRQALNRELFLSIADFEAHLARFAPGASYKPHLDQHRSSTSRILSTIIYLDENWNQTDGGQLRLYTDPAGGIEGPSLDIFPEAGKLVIFRSADYWHEVRPAGRPRHSVTGWFRGRGIL